MESKSVEMIKRHIEKMVYRQVEINKKVHDLNVEMQTIVDERAHLETTLFKIENAMEENDGTK